MLCVKKNLYFIVIYDKINCIMLMEFCDIWFLWEDIVMEYLFGEWDLIGLIVRIIYKVFL